MRPCALAWFALLCLGAVPRSGGAGAGKRKTLQDDPAFAEKMYQRNIEDDPGCEREARWAAFRLELLQTLQEARIDVAFARTMDWNLENASVVDEEAKKCMMGVVTMQYLFAHFLLHDQGSVEAAAHSFRLCDTHVGALHPDLFDRASGHGQLWPVTAAEVDRLRRQILRASVGGGTGGADRRRRFKNAFGLHDGDWADIWGSWRPDGSPLETVGKRGYGAASFGAPKPSFRVYVYDPDDYPALGHLARGAAFCKHNQWGMEVALHDWFLSCPCRTDNPEEADFFFVPHYTSCLLNHADTFKGCDTKQKCAPSTAHFEDVLRSSPHYRRTEGGRDHLFVWGSGMGADGAFASWRQWVPHGIFMMTETELWNPYVDVVEPSFAPHKDLIVPGRLTVDDMMGLVKLGKPVDERPMLGHFIGWPRPPHPSVMSSAECSNASCPLAVRSVLLALGETEPDMHVDVDVPYIESFLGLTNSIFCFVPRGKSAWSSRFFQTFFAGCVPVLLNDRYEAPFGQLLDVAATHIKWPMADVPGVVAHLRMLRDQGAEVVRAMLARGCELRCWYAWTPSWVEWSWLDLNRSKFNATCADYHVKNAYVAVTRLLAPKATRARHRFYWDGSPQDVPATAA